MYSLLRFIAASTVIVWCGFALSLKAAAAEPEKPGPVRAQGDPRPVVATDPAAADEDFAWQGEYASPGGAAESHDAWGLQVVALGAGRFDAVLFAGGLPGAEWDGRTRLLLTGNRGSEWVSLEGSGYQIRLTKEEARVTRPGGGDVVSLRKVQRTSPTEGARPTPDSIVLFDGSSVDQFEGARLTSDGLLDVGALTKVAVRDFHLHLEFRLPYMPAARGQGRGNSGVYIQQRYEVQILDSFGLRGDANECGGLYKQQPPDVNMCYPPLSWQTYDIDFRAARFDRCGNKIANARITVVHNGVPIQSDYAIVAKTGAGKAEGPDSLPILLQNHSNPVRFRNVWIELQEPVTYAYRTSQGGHRGKWLKSCLSRWRARRCR